MFITISISEFISYLIMNKPEHKLENTTILFAIAIYIIFVILTYYPPQLGIFKDPTNNLYGITK